MASVAQVEALAVTRSATRPSEPCGAIVALDPQHGEVGKQVRLPQSFLLSEVHRTPSMVLVRPTPVVAPEASTSPVVDTDATSSAVLCMATSAVESC